MSFAAAVIEDGPKGLAAAGVIKREGVNRMKVLVIDIGGTHVKVASTDHPVPVKIVSGPSFTAKQMVDGVLQATDGWEYEAITIGYPGPVVHDVPAAEPHNLGPGWVEFPYQTAFPKPVRFLNDAAMQALGGYKGGKMLFLGIGTGLGSALIIDHLLISLELAHLPYRKGRTYEEYIGLAGLERRGKRRWRKSVGDVVARLKAAFVADYVLLGGGNAKLITRLPDAVQLGANSNAIAGGFALWQEHPVARPEAVSVEVSKASGGAPMKVEPPQLGAGNREPLLKSQAEGKTLATRKGKKKSGKR